MLGRIRVSGFVFDYAGQVNLHANVCIPAKSRSQLENLCRYVSRPAIATERLKVLSDGRVMYGLRHPWRNGATSVIFEPLDLIGKLAALVPPPRFNLVRYHGIFGPASHWRVKIVPSDPVEEETQSGKEGGKPGGCYPRNYTWSELMRRVFKFDVLRCECGCRMRILCAVNPPEAIRKILDCLGLPSRPPPFFPAVEESFPEF